MLPAFMHGVSLFLAITHLFHVGPTAVRHLAIATSLAIARTGRLLLCPEIAFCLQITLTPALAGVLKVVAAAPARTTVQADIAIRRFMASPVGLLALKL